MSDMPKEIWVCKDRDGSNNYIATPHPFKFIEYLRVKYHHTSEIERLQEEIERLRRALQSAQAGLKWYQAEHPEDSSPADDEMHEEIDQALAKTEKRG